MISVHLVAIDDFTSRNFRLCLLVNVFVYRLYTLHMYSCYPVGIMHKDCRNTSKKMQKIYKRLPELLLTQHVYLQYSLVIF